MNAAMVRPKKSTPSYDEKLVAGLRHERPDVAAMSAEVLGARRVEAAVGSLIEALDRWRDADDVVMAAIHALAEIGDGQAVVPLIEILGSRSLRQRVAAAEALSRFDQPIARVALRRAQRDDPNAVVRAAAAVQG
jgi:HEAT repeat protein